MERCGLPATIVAICLLLASCASSEGAEPDSAAPAGEANDTAEASGTEAAPDAAEDENASSTDGDDTGDSDAPEGDGGDDEASEPGEDDDPAAFAYEGDDSAYIFDQSALHTFELTISEEDLAFLDADPIAEEYVPGSLTFEGETVENIGVRYKGSIGAFVGCLSGANPLIPSGEKTCTKLSMKLKINYDGSDQEFYGLKKLQFHSQNLDRSQMHDRLGYHLFREMGVPAPRSSHARVLINGEYAGLFSLVEQVDGRFTREVFDDGDGNLYKEVWPVKFGADGIELRTDEEMFEGLKTNENDDPSFDILRSFGSEIVDAGPDGAREVVEKWMDIEEVLAYSVVDRAIRHDDGPFHFYCFGPCSNHNYYLYEEPETEKVHIVAWDLDNAFDNILRDANPVTPIADGWGETTNDCEPFENGGFGLRQISAACDPIIGAWASFDEDYDRLREELISGPLAAENVDPLLEEWEAQIREATLEASETHDDALTIEEWEAALTDFKEALEFTRSAG